METIIILIILIFSVILHEVAHGYAAGALGDPTARLAGRLTLNPVPHVDLMGSIILPALLVFTNSPILFGWAKPVPYNPYNLTNQRWGETFVALAGVATNLVVAVLFGLVVRFGSLAGFDAAALSLAGTIAFVNLFLGLFNLIPFPPLDGFTALRSALPWNLSSGLRRAENYIQTAGMLPVLFFLLAFSYVLAGPFFAFARWVFGLLIGM